MTYLPELQVLWRNNIRPNARLSRAKNIRGREFVGELMLFHAMTGDDRFKGAIDALSDHGIIDDKLGFTRWRGPVVEKIEGNTDLTKMRIIQLRMENGRILHTGLCRVCRPYRSPGE
ncbi:hypothetical protein ACF1BQ_014535 [Bradyrhizobium sp. RDT10]